MFHLAFVLGFVPLLGVVLAAIGLTATRRDPAAAKWKPALVAVLIFDALVWPAAACVWLFGEPLVEPAAPDAHGWDLTFWDVWGGLVLRVLAVGLLIPIAAYLQSKSRHAATALRWVLLAVLAMAAVELGLTFVEFPTFAVEIVVLLSKVPPGLVLLVMAVVALRWMRGRFGESEETGDRLSRGAGFGLALL